MGLPPTDPPPAEDGRPDAVLSVRKLSTWFPTGTGTNRAVDEVSFDVRPGEVVGVVGESGSGKSTLGLSLLRLVSPPGRIQSGQVLLDGRDLLQLDDEQMRAVRGREIAMVFQNPSRSLHPGFSIGWQLREAVRSHQPGLRRREADARAVAALTDVGVPDPGRRLRDYPHQFSGGMQQRVMIAMALVNQPRVLVADEPTTALDVTIQAQILALLRRLAAEHGMAVVFVTHNLGVVSALCHRVVVMYAGQAVEEGPVDVLFHRPCHPYTQALLDALPESAAGPRLRAVPGAPPQAVDDQLTGCRFRPRCYYAEPVCQQMPELAEIGSAQRARCWVGQRHGRLPAPPVREPA